MEIETQQDLTGGNNNKVEDIKSYLVSRIKFDNSKSKWLTINKDQIWLKFKTAQILVLKFYRGNDGQVRFKKVKDLYFEAEIVVLRQSSSNFIKVQLSNSQIHFYSDFDKEIHWLKNQDLPSDSLIFEIFPSIFKVMSENDLSSIIKYNESTKSIEVIRDKIKLSLLIPIERKFKLDY